MAKPPTGESVRSVVARFVQPPERLVLAMPLLWTPLTSFGGKWTVAVLTDARFRVVRPDGSTVLFDEELAALEVVTGKVAVNHAYPVTFKGRDGALKAKLAVVGGRVQDSGLLGHLAPHSRQDRW